MPSCANILHIYCKHPDICLCTCVAVLEGQLEQLCPHAQIYYMFTVSILISVCAHAVAVLDGQLEQLCPHAQIYYMFTASILISACTHAVAILDGQLEQLHTHAQIYHIFTASILISVCAYWRHPSTCRTPIMMCMYQSHRTIVPHSHSGLTQRLQ